MQTLTALLKKTADFGLILAMPPTTKLGFPSSYRAACVPRYFWKAVCFPKPNTATSQCLFFSCRSLPIKIAQSWVKTWRQLSLSSQTQWQRRCHQLCTRRFPGRMRNAAIIQNNTGKKQLFVRRLVERQLQLPQQQRGRLVLLPVGHGAEPVCCRSNQEAAKSPPSMR